jgi:hypothetical protein
MKLQKIFEDMRKNNIYVNLDDNYCTTTYTDDISVKNKGYIGYIYSISDIDEIIECIIEEGSAIVTYSFYECSSLFKNKEIFTELIISFFGGFEFKLIDGDSNKKIEIVITSENLCNDIIEKWNINKLQEDSEDEYDYEYEYDNEEYMETTSIEEYSGEDKSEDENKE